MTALLIDVVGMLILLGGIIFECVVMFIGRCKGSPENKGKEKEGWGCWIQGHGPGGGRQHVDG